MPPATLDITGKAMLIEVVKNIPHLYNRTKDRKHKVIAWDHVSKALDVSVDECMRNWRNLRDTYSRELHKSINKSGFKTSYKSRWNFYASLSFLEPFVSYKTRPKKKKIMRLSLAKSKRCHALPSARHNTIASGSLEPVVINRDGVDSRTLTPGCRDNSSSSRTAEYRGLDHDDRDGVGSRMLTPGCRDDSSSSRTAEYRGLDRDDRDGVGSRKLTPGCRDNSSSSRTTEYRGLGRDEPEHVPAPDTRPSEDPVIRPKEKPSLQASSADGITPEVLSSAVNAIKDLQRQLAEHQAVTQKQILSRQNQEDAEFYFAMSIACRLRQMTPQNKAIARSEIEERLLQVEYGAPISNTKY